MDKKLKPYTIIPPELYVKRDADRQIKSIIEDMGRPGYVLVSRQMGKTNLLLNAKRTLESSNDIFIYIDLSNLFYDARSCFENIVDTILDINSEHLIETSSDIFSKREKRRVLPPHKQHIDELRLILKAIKGKLVIILDEIDALTKTDYSDLIFAQIRSVYFSRVNYPELERLTYILSGVVEPSEIIKDPKISPFNIGQKIFLNDFNKDEFEELIFSSNINSNKVIIDRIFYWTNGNPRMSWDVCSEVETLSQNQELTENDVDKIVKDLYLTTFNKPPIDNIRELIKNDRELRNSIIELYYEKGNLITDKLKSKLYLSGIINFNENEIKIKNEIIKNSINIDWINSLEIEEKGYYRIATDYFEKENFEKAIEYFEKYLSENDNIDNDLTFLYYYLGQAYQGILQHEKALENFQLTSFSKEDNAKSYYTTKFLKAISYYKTNNLQESLNSLKEVISSERKDEIYLRALVNYGSYCLNSGVSEKLEEAYTTFNSIILGNGIDKDKVKKSFLDKTLSIAHYNLALFHKLKSENKMARKNYEEALKMCENLFIPNILMGLIEVSDSDDEKKELIKKIINKIKDDKIIPVQEIIDSTNEFSYSNITMLAIEISKFKDLELLHLMLPFMQYVSDSETLSRKLFDLALYNINKKRDFESGIFIIYDIFNNFDNPEYEVDENLKTECIKDIVFYETDIKKEESILLNKYLENFLNEETTLTSVDLRILANHIYTHKEKHHIANSQLILDRLRIVNNNIKDEAKPDYLVILNLELNIYLENNQIDKAIYQAELISSFISDNEYIRKEKNTLLGEEGLQIISENAKFVLANFKQKKVNFTNKPEKYGRNDFVKVQYKNGKIVEIKYKKIEKDILNGECEIIN
ncbi:AAA-like domain-containing protein [Flavobacterium sp.]|uniref:AAA-like domain-containing protein n=1 Tax=Flavobacterium sp. TaxID=239 RepID=UPI0026182856|nr:AAA-like domain-containing protein [Flavobacterium sp.]